MGTRSRIAFENEDGTIISTYCHWDGYPDHNGKVLRTHFTTPERALAVASAGYISFLEGDGDLNKSIANSANIGPPSRDLCIQEMWLTLGGEEYVYLFRDGEWVYSRAGRRNFRPLAKAKLSK